MPCMQRVPRNQGWKTNSPDGGEQSRHSRGQKCGSLSCHKMRQQVENSKRRWGRAGKLVFQQDEGSAGFQGHSLPQSRLPEEEVKASSGVCARESIKGEYRARGQPGLITVQAPVFLFIC